MDGSSSSPGKLILSHPGKPDQEFVLRDGTLILGRAQISDIVIPDTRISRSHASLECSQGSCLLKDLGSVNGTWVNGHRVTEVRLKHGDSLAVGDSMLRFEVMQEDPSPELSMTAIAPDFDGGEDQESGSLPIEVTNTREPRLVIHTPNGTSEVALKDGLVQLGRDPRNEVVLNTAESSRRHAVIERRNDSFFIRDLGSTNGTWVRGQRVTEQVLEDGDTIRVGRVRMVFKKGFVPEELTMLGGFGDLPSPSSLASQRPVIIVPGLMGSELWLGSEKVWPNPKYLLTNPEIACLPDQCGLEAKCLVSEVVVVPNVVKMAQYNRLTEHLEEALGYERGKNLLEFPYDWRLDNRISARKLGAAIEAWQERSPEARGPITLIAHSLGCLVSRYYVDCLGGSAKVKRIIFLGGPHYGVPKAVPSLMRGPDILPFGLMNERIRRVLCTFPTTYQILPTYPCVVDRKGRKVNVLTEDGWLSTSQRQLLRDADHFRRELGPHCSVPSVSIFGYGIKTITEMAIRDEEEGVWKKADILFEAKGDSAIPERSTVLEGSEIHPVRQYHGSLYVDNDVKMRLKVELLRG
ncbi:MAG: FHA domain-containing protein [Acidobacteria bacterium]|nr:MAG: FHA domain-containing protein [Acidobacteriota bacterium]